MENSTNTATIDAIEPEAISLPAFYYIGISARTDLNSESVPQTAKIGELWQRFYGEQVSAKIPNQVIPPRVLGIYSDYETDYKGKYNITAGCDVNSLEAVPPGMAAGHIPAQKYLKFTARGAQPSSIMKAWANIWSYFGKSDHPMRAYTDDFELYKSPELVEIYIAVK